MYNLKSRGKIFLVYHHNRKWFANGENKQQFKLLSTRQENMEISVFTKMLIFLIKVNTNLKL